MMFPVSVRKSPAKGFLYPPRHKMRVPADELPIRLRWHGAGE